jgi:hypothetical protein
MRTIRRLVILLVVMACWEQVSQAYEYFTINFIDGSKSDIFYTVAVDSMRYSKYDLDSIEHNSWEVQEIWTPDSVYRYAIADIDYFSFDDEVEIHELPVGKGALKVLIIGNSFSDDPMAYFDGLIRASGIDRDSLCVYSASKAGASLQYWAKTCAGGDTVTITRRSGSLEMPVTQAPLKELMAQDWDVVTVQQVSTLAKQPKKLSLGLPYLVNQIRKHCLNDDVVIAWHQIWSYWSEEGQLETSISDWEAISDVVKLTYDYGIDMIIPTGTALQNARCSTLNTEHGLTRDGKHLGYGIGRYVAACTWFEALIAPVYGVSVVGNPYIHVVTETEESYSTYETASVTDDNRIQCQQCSAAAVDSPFELSDY